MNRDWFAQSQPETRGRLRLFVDWYPHVAVDLHEMGGDSTYFFANYRGYAEATELLFKNAILLGPAY